ncbi:MAG: hypothetical protein MZV63_66700 [Marinilabiliales bacterium]|nr:hypothetical protein [Marinilabiliales bacterium]
MTRLSLADPMRGAIWGQFVGMRSVSAVTGSMIWRGWRADIHPAYPDSRRRSLDTITMARNRVSRPITVTRACSCLSRLRRSAVSTRLTSGGASSPWWTRRTIRATGILLRRTCWLTIARSVRHGRLSGSISSREPMIVNLPRRPA